MGLGMAMKHGAVFIVSEDTMVPKKIKIKCDKSGMITSGTNCDINISVWKNTVSPSTAGIYRID